MCFPFPFGGIFKFYVNYRECMLKMQLHTFWPFLMISFCWVLNWSFELFVKSKSSDVFFPIYCGLLFSLLSPERWGMLWGMDLKEFLTPTRFEIFQLGCAVFTTNEQSMTHFYHVKWRAKEATRWCFCFFFRTRAVRIRISSACEQCSRGPWLVVLNRLYYPLLWGLFHKPI